MGVSLLAVLAGCKENENKSDFKYTIDQFADLKVIRYQIPGWDELSLKQKTYAYHLAEAAGRFYTNMSRNSANPLKSSSPAKLVPSTICAAWPTCYPTLSTRDFSHRVIYVHNFERLHTNGNLFFWIFAAPKRQTNLNSNLWKTRLLPKIGRQRPCLTTVWNPY